MLNVPSRPGQAVGRGELGVVAVDEAVRDELALGLGDASESMRGSLEAMKKTSGISRFEASSERRAVGLHERLPRSVQSRGA